MGTERGGFRRSSSSSHGDGNMKITVSNLYFLILTFFLSLPVSDMCTLEIYHSIFQRLADNSNDEHLQTKP